MAFEGPQDQSFVCAQRTVRILDPAEVEQLELQHASYVQGVKHGVLIALIAEAFLALLWFCSR